MDFEKLAQGVARAEADLEDAKAALGACLTTRQEIEQRIAEKRTEIVGLRTRLAAGEITDREAGGLASLLQADVDDLGGLVAEADSGVAAARDAVEKATIALRSAEKALADRVAREEFTRFHDHVRATEKAFLDSLAELASIAKGAGMSTSSVRGFFQISNDLVRVTQGVVPARTGGAS